MRNVHRYWRCWHCTKLILKTRLWALCWYFPGRYGNDGLTGWQRGYYAACYMQIAGNPHVHYNEEGKWLSHEEWLTKCREVVKMQPRPLPRNYHDD